MSENESERGDSASEDADASASLAAFQLADSFLPVGTYTISYGVEQFAATGRVETRDDLEALLRDYLHQQVGPCDVVALAAAWDRAEAADGETLDALAAVDERQRSVTLPREFRESSENSGRRLLELMAETTDDDVIEAYYRRVLAEEAPGNHAVALGLVARRQGIAREDACLLACHSFVVGLLGAAQRLVRLTHTDAQRLLTTLRPVMCDVCETYAGRDPETMAPFAPLVDVMGMGHERAERRLFVS
ncbi:urease accessory protein UreF [Salinigranum rubrum]|uniref:Urease accessory protein UreF n=1 Tax=Salinigranum rubrum TaxID=755307 RepID=A0A2I8VEE0_9EURY|nr:urease accessory UreF family protein [Salinigranum rubrum]AUV80271.1 urease accessory protein UreF [Salinigranum rubrum]